MLQISSFYSCVAKTTTIWGMVPEIWSLTDRIFCHFGPFFPLYPSNNPKNQNFGKNKKLPEISSFYKSVSKIMISYTAPQKWSVTDIIFIFDFGLFFALLTPNSPKNQILKKMKKRPGDISLYTCVPKIMIIW